MIIRDMRESDIPIFLEWLKAFNSSFEFAGQGPINEAVARLFFSRFLDSASQSCVVATDKSGQPIATIGFSVIPHPWTGESVLYKAFWYAPKAGAGIKLLRYVIELCRKGNIEQVIIGSMQPRVSRLLERNGFKAVETNYTLLTRD